MPTTTGTLTNNACTVPKLGQELMLGSDDAFETELRKRNVCNYVLNGLADLMHMYIHKAKTTYCVHRPLCKKTSVDYRPLLLSCQTPKLGLYYV